MYFASLMITRIPLPGSPLPVSGNSPGISPNCVPRRLVVEGANESEGQRPAPHMLYDVADQDGEYPLSVARMKLSERQERYKTRTCHIHRALLGTMLKRIRTLRVPTWANRQAQVLTPWQSHRLLQKMMSMMCATWLRRTRVVGPAEADREDRWPTPLHAQCLLVRSTIFPTRSSLTCCVERSQGRRNVRPLTGSLGSKVRARVVHSPNSTRATVCAPFQPLTASARLARVSRMSSGRSVPQGRSAQMEPAPAASPAANLSPHGLPNRVGPTATPSRNHESAMHTLPNVLAVAQVILTDSFAPRDILDFGRHTSHWRVLHGTDREEFVRAATRVRDTLEACYQSIHGPAGSDTCYRQREPARSAAGA